MILSAVFTREWSRSNSVLATAFPSSVISYSFFRPSETGKMGERGYRLTAVDKMLYEFEECNPGSVEYRVEYIGSKSKSNGREYFQFLEEMGYFIFFFC